MANRDHSSTGSLSFISNFNNEEEEESSVKEQAHLNGIQQRQQLQQNKARMTMTDLEEDQQQHNKTAAAMMADWTDNKSVHSGISEVSDLRSKASTHHHQQNRPSQLALKETRAVRITRLLVFLVLLLATAGVSTCVYMFTRHDEVAEFEETFSEYAEQITRTVHRNAQHKLEATGAIALQVQAHAIDTGAVWPNVTIPYFEERIMATQSLTDAYGVQLFPVVTNETRLGWEAYSVENRDWLNASFFAQRQVYGEDQSRLEPGEASSPDFNWFDHLWGPKFYNEENPDFSSGISSKIFGTRFNAEKHPIVDPNDGPFFPQWQTAPASWYYQTTVNSNYGNFADFFNQTQIIRETSTAAFGMAWSDGNTPGYISTMLYPIFDIFYGTNQPEVVAFVGIDLFWQAFIERILPPNADGIYVVIENAPPCDQMFTFQLYGDTAVFVGDGDGHEVIQRFDSMKQSFLFGSHLMEPITEPTYTGRPLYDDFCPYTFHLYPSAEMEARYVTHKPIMYTVIVVCVFLFTSLVFYVFDHLVERRQKLVIQSANQADRVVSSLFPQSVKERLYEKEQRQDDQKTGAVRESTIAGLVGGDVREFMGLANPTPSPDIPEVSPIAELYPETTIMFADLVGFTSWSADRVPCEVFQLLESIYGIFDAAARKRQVFKVETIGDCYVAVTGIPKPQQHHALIMAKFADECRQKMRSELDNLAESLGPKTLDLRLRTGLHSGPVTAGVLRGDKARFQLFGDSMNTAARMESHSAPDCIHVSKATANLIREAGKGHWVRAREDKINPKGKGEMQTFWVSVRSGSSVATLSNMDLSSNKNLDVESDEVL